MMKTLKSETEINVWGCWVGLVNISSVNDATDEEVNPQETWCTNSNEIKQRFLHVIILETRGNRDNPRQEISP